MMEINSGDFIFHNTYGVGRIQDVKAPTRTNGQKSPGNMTEIFDVQIHFQSGDVKTFSSELLNRSAKKISPEGFRAFAYLNPEGAKQMLDHEPVEAIAMLFMDFPGLTAKTEDFKDYLTPYVPEWDAWWEKVQPKLKESNRIDTSKSKLREYRLSRELLSPAEEVYQAFHRLRPFESKLKVYEQARRVLEKHSEGAELPKEHLEDVLGYIEQIIRSAKEPLQLRLDAVFRLQEGKWLEKSRGSEYLDQMLVSELRLYQLDLYALNRVVEYLINNPLTESKREILATSICAGEPAIKAIVEWALQNGDPDFVERLLVTALKDNIPPQLDVEKLDTLAVRLRYAKKLVISLGLESKCWESVISHHRVVVNSLSGLDEKVYLPMIPNLISFSETLYKRLEAHKSGLSNKVLDNLLTPDLPMRYVLSIIDNVRKDNKYIQFRGILEKLLWANAEQRKYDFLECLTDLQESDLARIKLLMNALEEYKSDVLLDHVGSLICEIVGKNEQIDKIEFLPYLNKLHTYRSTSAWSNTLEGLREKIYIEVFQRPDDELGDQALASAARITIASGLKEKTEEIKSLKENYEKEKIHAKSLEELLVEKEQVIRELRSGFGGDASNARFEERVRIVKDLASSIAEFERMAARLPEKSRELEAVILRLNSLLAGLQVSPMEEVGVIVQFNPQKHRAVGSDSIATGENVAVFERGYLIQDNRGKTRLLKPSLVKK